MSASLAEVETSAELLSQVRQLLEARLSPEIPIVAPFLYNVRFWEAGGDLSQTAWSYLQQLTESKAGVESVKSLLVTAAQFQSPLYIGKADKLRTRIGQHVTGVNSELRELLAQANVRIEKCLLRFIYVDDESAPADGVDMSTAIRSLEELLTRIAPASFVRRPG